MTVIYMKKDENILAGLKAGDGSAFEALLDLYGDRVLKICYLILKDLPAAEDAVQEIFIQIYKSIKKFKGNSSLYTWIYKIAVNKCRDLLKDKGEYYLNDEDINLLSESNVEYEAIESMSRKWIRDAVFTLKPAYREVITLFYFEELSIKEICDVLNEGEGTVKSKLHRARNILKKLLLKEGICYGEE